MDLNVNIKQVTGFKTPKQYSCVKLRHENSYKQFSDGIVVFS